MNLYSLLKGVATTSLPDVEINNICSDSRKLRGDGTLFVCLKGETFDAHTAVPKLSEQGVSVFVVQYDCGVENQIIVPDTREALSLIWANFCGNPQTKLKFIGVTGTNGKTTVTTVIKNLLQDLGHKSGLIGTFRNEIGNEYLPAERTTPEPDEFFPLLQKMVDSGCEYVVMEVSSQGLALKRLAGCKFEVGVFTNLTQDHLDFHKTMENYYLAKKELFLNCNNALINTDDAYGRRLFEEISCCKYSFSENHEADYRADGIKLSGSGSSFWLSTPQKTFKIESLMTGSYNVANISQALVTLSLIGIDLAKLQELIKSFVGVRGRLETVKTGKDFSVILDYAHTPDALENVLSCVRGFTKGRVVCLFGCGGNRDAKKRPLMAKSAAKFADMLYVTSDNPRNEDPHQIILEVLEGLNDTSCPYVAIDDRREAIFKAILDAKSGDTIVLAGKGHEDYQVLANEVKIHFDEREIVAEALNALK